jgi:hypothetical protein
MQPTDARTVAELAAMGRHIVVRCIDCDWSRNVLPDVLSATFGEDFDVISNIAELRSQLRCDRCGRRHRSVELAREIDKPVSRLTRRRA